MTRWLFILICVLLNCKTVLAQTHFTAVSNTGNNAIIGIPVSINPTVGGILLELNDDIAVFANGRIMPDSFCVGVTKWNQSNISITVWGDNEQTPALDGMKAGTKYHFRVWKYSTNKEYTNAKVTYAQGDSLYRANGISVLASFSGGDVHAVPTIVAEQWTAGTIPRKFMISQNYPNPFNPATTFMFGVPVDSKVKIELFNILGQLILVPVDEVRPAGYHKVTFGGLNMTSGVYFYRVTAGSFVQTKRMQLIK
jgi:hypothetical protein